MVATHNRKAEFAKFFDLFERLTNRALRKNRAQEQVSLVTAEASKPFAVPADLALPAIRNLSSIASDNRTSQQQTVHRDGQENSKANSVIEENTVVEDKEEMNKFLAGSWYPFTFKMMLHKLYELEEWARKLKNILEKSREDYKSLSEVDLKKKKGNGEECQRGRTQSREVMGSYLAAVQTCHNSGLDNAAVRKGTTVPKSPTKDNGKKSRDKFDEKVIRKRRASRPRIATTAQDCRLGGPRVYDPSAAIIEVEDVLCEEYSSEDCSIKSGDTSMAEGSRLRYATRSASAWESEGAMSCTSAHRKRALSEADSTYPQISPRKRPYLR